MDNYISEDQIREGHEELTAEAFAKRYCSRKRGRIFDCDYYIECGKYYFSPSKAMEFHKCLQSSIG